MGDLRTVGWKIGKLWRKYKPGGRLFDEPKRTTRWTTRSGKQRGLHNKGCPVRGARKKKDERGEKFGKEEHSSYFCVPKIRKGMNR